MKKCKHRLSKIEGYAHYKMRNKDEYFICETCSVCGSTFNKEITKEEFEVARKNGYYRIVDNDLTRAVPRVEK